MANDMNAMDEIVALFLEHGAEPRPFKIDWRKIENKFGVALPKSYKYLMDHIESVAFYDVYRMLDPHSKYYEERLVERNEVLLERHNLYWGEMEGKPDCPPPPHDGSFVAWMGSTDCSGMVWKIEGGVLIDRVHYIANDDYSGEDFENYDFSTYIGKLIRQEIGLPYCLSLSEYPGENFIDPVEMLPLGLVVSND